MRGVRDGAVMDDQEQPEISVEIVDGYLCYELGPRLADGPKIFVMVPDDMVREAYQALLEREAETRLEGLALRVERSKLDSELRSRQLALAEHMSPEAWDRFQAHQRGELVPGDGDEADAKRLRDILDDGK